MTSQNDTHLVIRRDVLRRRLYELNCTMDEFKSSSGVDPRTLERILSGKTRNPHTATVRLICRAANLTVEQLFRLATKSPLDKIEDRQFTPFSVGSAIPHPHYFHGRQSIVEKLANLWRSEPMQNAAVIGNSGIGKTSLFKYLIRLSDDSYLIDREPQCSNRLKVESTSWLYLDLSNPTLASPANVHSAILTQFQIPHDSASLDSQEFFDRMGSIFPDKRCVIVFDETDVALGRSAAHEPDTLDNRFWEGMRYLSTLHPDRIAFMLGCKMTPFRYASAYNMSSPFFNIFGYTTELGPLSVDDSQAMFKTSTELFSQQDCDWIVEQSALYPRLLQLFCWELLTTLNGGSYSESWRNAALAKATHLPEYQSILS